MRRYLSVDTLNSIGSLTTTKRGLNLMNDNSINSKKSTFFTNFYHLWVYEGYEDPMKAVEIATGDAGISLTDAIDALKEVENNRLDTLAMSKNTPAFVWFTAYAGALAKFIEKSTEENIH